MAEHVKESRGLNKNPMHFYLTVNKQT